MFNILLRLLLSRHGEGAKPLALYQTRMWLKTTSLQANTNTEDVITASLHVNMVVAEDMITA